jgi:hypothetical protein
MISNDEFDNTIPVRPPRVNKKINPSVQSIDVLYLILAP